MAADLLVSAPQLADLLARNQALAVDCRFDLADPESGRRAFLQGHLPGAQYAHLGEDLSSAMTATSGRHPPPGASQFAAFLSRIGWTRDRLLVAYDERNNSISARLWWQMRYFGLRAALLDGGLAAWTGAGLPLESGPARQAPSEIPRLAGNPAMIAETGEILRRLGDPGLALIDARAADRFAGARSPLDTVGGHIPGARSRPLAQNLQASGCFKDPAQLRSEFGELLGGASPETVVNYCGSGVTACHNLFAMELAGLGPARVYPGSWSEWTRDEARPVETGSGAS